MEVHSALPFHRIQLWNGKCFLKTLGNPRGNPAGRKGKVKVMLMMMVSIIMNMYRETI